jgi:hypothetical protein
VGGVIESVGGGAAVILAPQSLQKTSMPEGYSTCFSKFDVGTIIKMPSVASILVAACSNVYSLCGHELRCLIQDIVGTNLYTLAAR